MDRPYRYINVEQQDKIFCVRFRQLSFNDLELDELGTEIARLVDEGGCRKMILCLGPEEPECLYSVFLAKLVSLQKRLQNDGGALALAELTDSAKAIFQASGLDRFFRFYPNSAAACAALQ